MQTDKYIAKALCNESYKRTYRRTEEQLQVQRIFLAYIQTDGCMDNCSEKPLCNESPQCTYVRTEEHQSYVRQPRFGFQDAAIWGRELKDNLDK